MFCSECGTQNPNTNRFCNSCGKPLLQQPAAQPLVPPAAAPVETAPPAVTAGAPEPAVVQKSRKNWLGILSLIFGILSWGILTTLFALIAVLLGVIAIYLFRKATGKTGILSVIGIVLGIAAVIVTLLLP